MSDFKLDIDSPYPTPLREKLQEKPRPVPYAPSTLRHKHYGRVLETMVKTVAEMEDGEEKDILTLAIANQMKKSYLTWLSPLDKPSKNIFYFVTFKPIDTLIRHKTSKCSCKKSVNCFPKKENNFNHTVCKKAAGSC